MKTSVSIVKITEALLKAQVSIGAVKKGAENPFFKSRYADLSSVIEAVKVKLNENGIVAVQPISGDYVDTVLIHTSGEWLRGRTKIVCAKANDPQAYGSAITYARRYGLQSFLLLPAEDDDGEGAMGRQLTTSAGKQDADLMYTMKNLVGFVNRMKNATEESDRGEVDKLIYLADRITHFAGASEKQKNWVSEEADSMCDRLGIGLSVEANEIDNKYDNVKE